VSSQDTKWFYALRPLTLAQTKTGKKQTRAANQTPKSTLAATNVVSLPVQAVA
jgi:hypothetical protein